MKLASIIAEYNPFHNGHKYQIEKAREILGDDVAIIAIMSGNYTQRGELAIADKTVRAKAAVLAGVNLVLELPFPFSSSSAEIFATSGVHIANSIGSDYLIFGSECGNIAAISNTADIMLSKQFESIITDITSKKENICLSYPKIIETAYKTISNNDLSLNISMPNNILAVEYVKAIKKINSNIKPITIKREGAGYSEKEINTETEYQSATSIRDLIANNVRSAQNFIPKNAFHAFSEAILSGLMPSDSSKLNNSIITSLRLNSALSKDIFDADAGLYNRLCTLSTKTNSVSSLVALAETKTYTKARIRRAILNSFFGVTSSLAKELPAFTQVLAMDEIGCSVLKRIKKTTQFPCITKPSDYTKYSERVIAQKEFSNKADSVYALTLPGDISGTFHLTFTPFVKK